MSESLESFLSFLRSEKVTEDLRVEGKKWVAVFEDHKLQDLEQRLVKLEQWLVKLKQTTQEDALVCGVPLVQNVAAEVLLFALGRQSQTAPEGNSFMRLANKSLSKDLQVWLRHHLLTWLTKSSTGEMLASTSPTLQRSRWLSTMS